MICDTCNDTGVLKSGKFGSTIRCPICTNPAYPEGRRRMEMEKSSISEAAKRGLHHTICWQQCVEGGKSMGAFRCADDQCENAAKACGHPYRMMECD